MVKIYGQTNLMGISKSVNAQAEAFSEVKRQSAFTIVEPPYIYKHPCALLLKTPYSRFEYNSEYVY